jgi:hypothetical protein
MALQGNLRDFSASEILQLLGTQKKSGCLTLEQGGRHVAIYVLEGRVVSTRTPGLSKDDPLLAFLRQAHRLSDEQQRGIQTIQRESSRDLEDLLLNGRYLDAEELAGFVERQILDDLMRLARWEEGAYRFDPHSRWAQPPLVRLSIEGVLMEVARRADEQRRYRATFPDPHQILGVRDLPDPGVELSDEERDLFGIVDGRHTLDEVVAAAPLSEYETYEALQRMSDAGWLEVVGRRDPGLAAPPLALPVTERPGRARWERDAVVAVVLIAVVAALRLAAHFVTPAAPLPVTGDVFAAAQVRDVRMALDLYRREHGAYPPGLDELVATRWLSRAQLRVAGHDLAYRSGLDGRDYRLDITADP